MTGTWGKIGLLVLAPLVFLAALEGLFWAFDVAPAPDEADPRSEQVVPGFDPEARAAQLRSKPEGRPRVACFGGSSIAGMPLDYTLSMCTLAAAALGPDPVVINDSGRGFDSHHVLSLAEVTCRFPHDLVVIYSGHNEFINLHLFRRGTHAAVRKAAGFLSRFRFFRAMQGWLGGAPERAEPMAREELGEAAISDQEVFARYERNLNQILDACTDNPVVLSTVVSNAGFVYPMDGMTTRESVAALKAGRATPDPRVRYRARPEINAIIRKVARQRRVALFDAEALIAGKDPFELFWDGVHPKPALHLALAQGILETAKAAGFIDGFRPPTITLDAQTIQRAGEQAAFEAMGLDPRFVLRILRSSAHPVNTFGVAMAMGITGFLAHDDEAIAQGFTAVSNLLKQEGYRRVFEGCTGLGVGRDGAHRRVAQGEKGCGLRCLPFPCGRGFLRDDERAELVALVKAYHSPVLTRLCELF